MIFKEIKTVYNVIKKLVQSEVAKNKPFDIYIVTESNTNDYTVNIRNYYFANLQFDNVRISGIGLGNGNGIIKIPKKDDMVLVGFVGPNVPLVLGSLFCYENGREIDADFIPEIKVGETMIIGNSGGSYIYIKENGSISLAGNNGPAIARIGDKISVTIDVGSSAGTYEGTITSGSTKVTSE